MYRNRRKSYFYQFFKWIYSNLFFAQSYHGFKAMVGLGQKKRLFIEMLSRKYDRQGPVYLACMTYRYSGQWAEQLYCNILEIRDFSKYICDHSLSLLCIQTSILKIFIQISEMDIMELNEATSSIQIGGPVLRSR